MSPGSPEVAQSLPAGPAGREPGVAVPAATGGGLAHLWRAMRVGASVGVFLMMMLGLFDVLGRKLLDRPLRGSVELTELLMMIVVFLGITLVSRQQAHVHLDLIDGSLKGWVAQVRARVGECISGMVLAGAAWISATKAMVSAGQNEATSLLQIPLAPAYLLVAVLLAVAALAHFALAFGARHPGDKEDGS